jgi:hypothetical protein
MMGVERKEIHRLAEFLLRNYSNEIGKGNPKEGESAVDVAIRLLTPIKCEEPIACITAKDCSPAVFEMLTALSKEVASLKRDLASANDQLDTLYRNQVKQAELHEAHGQDIRMLDDRTQSAKEAR